MSSARGVLGDTNMFNRRTHLAGPAIIVGLTVHSVVWSGCRADRGVTAYEEPPSAGPVNDARAGGVPPPEVTGGGPADHWSRDGVIDRLAHARCEAKQRCGDVAPVRGFMSYSECVATARHDLRFAFGAPTCEAYADDRVDACAQKQVDARCGTEDTLSAECVEASLCAPP